MIKQPETEDEKLIASIEADLYYRQEGSGFDKRDRGNRIKSLLDDERKRGVALPVILKYQEYNLAAWTLKKGIPADDACKVLAERTPGWPLPEKILHGLLANLPAEPIDKATARPALRFAARILPGRVAAAARDVAVGFKETAKDVWQTGDLNRLYSSIAITSTSVAVSTLAHYRSWYDLAMAAGCGLLNETRRAHNEGKLVSKFGPSRPTSLRR
jgi:hypothetical protein